MASAALYDIHGNVHALDAVLEELRDRRDVDVVVVGGDVANGPFPVETVERLLGLQWPARFVMGNGDRALLAAHGEGGSAGDPWREANGWCRGRRPSGAATGRWRVSSPTRT